jgi:hypothetical protein
MNDNRRDEPSPDFERQARQAFDDSLAHLDAATLSRLNQSRQRALVAAAGRKASSHPRWLTWVPAGAVAAAALVAVLLLRSPDAPEAVVVPVATNGAADATLDPLVIVAAGDDLELAAEADLEFYAWVELETTDDGII